MRLVLDTNVWLDWLLFESPSVQPLARLAASSHERSASGSTLELLATETMLAEAATVFGRSQFARFGLDEAALAALQARQRSLVQVCPPAPDCRLPCTDRDDQMFIDLAVARQVDWLISRDKALLRLRRQAWRRFGLHIGTPEQWWAAVGDPTDTSTL